MARSLLRRPDMPKPPEPFSLKDPRNKELREILSRLYYNEERIVGVLLGAGLDPSIYNLHGDARLIWGDALRVAHGALQLDAILDHVAQSPEAARWKARIAELRQAHAPLEPEKAPTAPAGPREKDLVKELILGETSTLLDVAFLARGVARAPAVVRLLAAWASGDRGTGTGFLFRGSDPAEPPKILTNHHVVVSEAGETAVQVKAQLHYERDVSGAERAVETIDLHIDDVRLDATHDWAVLPIRGAPKIPCEPIVLARPTLPVAEGQRVYIIQHPRGNLKQIGLHRNLVTSVTDDIVQYLTDTEPGSSGSPVFNDRWELVALHHASRYVGDEQAEAVKSLTAGDRTGWVRPYRNEGVRIERVIEGVLGKGT